jgi:NAD(P)-dependent dehydrogenase (short-subunit alcohol dehydrogenase family)
LRIWTAHRGHPRPDEPVRDRQTELDERRKFVNELPGKVAVITGAGSGIGRATARLLAESGMNVVLADIDKEALDAAVEGIRGGGHRATGVVTDVADFASMQQLAASAYAEFGAVHVLHLNAGIASGASLFDDATDDWDRILGVNLKGVVWGIKAFIQKMVDSDVDGYVIATSSGAGSEGTTYQTPSYAATKIAVMSIMECLYGQLRDRQSRIRAGVLFPPLTATNLSGSPEMMKHVEGLLRSRGVPATLIEPDQVARVVLDGIQRDRFFFRVGPEESDRFFDGKLSDGGFFDWNERVIRARAEEYLSDGKPDSYLW